MSDDKGGHQYTVEEAAAYLGLKVSTIYAWTHFRKIKYQKLTNNELRFKKEDLDDIRERRSQENGDGPIVVKKKNRPNGRISGPIQEYKDIYQMGRIFSLGDKGQRALGNAMAAFQNLAEITAGKEFSHGAISADEIDQYLRKRMKALELVTEAWLLLQPKAATDEDQEGN